MKTCHQFVFMMQSGQVVRSRLLSNPINFPLIDDKIKLMLTRETWFKIQTNVFSFETAFPKTL